MAEGRLVTTVTPSDALGDDFVSIHGRQSRNKAGAVVSEIRDIDYVKRFLILGRLDLKYVFGGDPQHGENDKIRTKIESLIESGEGRKVVYLMKDISVNYRNISHDPMMFCLAFCARCDNIETKRQAYGILNDVCRIPTHLFKFIEYYNKLTKQCHKDDESLSEKVDTKEKKREEKIKKKRESLQRKNDNRRNGSTQLKLRKENDHAAYGWGHSFRRAIAKWFLKFEDKPEKLVYLLTKYRRRCGWSVKVIIRLAHIKAPDKLPNNSPTDNQKAIGLILRYFRSNLKKACEEYNINLDNASGGNMVEKVAKRLKEYDELRKTTDKDSIKKIIEEAMGETRPYKSITFEHLSTQVLSEKNSDCKEIWRALIPCLPGEALIRHAGFLTRICALEANTPATINAFERRLKDFLPPSSPTRRPVHPFKILTALLHYKECITQSGRHWEPIDVVSKIIQEAFEKSLGCNSTAIAKKMCVAIDVSRSMLKTANEERQGINGKKDEIDCLLASQAVAYTLAKMAQSIHLVVFNKNGCRKVDGYETFADFQSKIKKIELEESQKSDCNEPLKWAQEEELKDIDAFVVFTVSELVGGRIEPVQGITEYRKFCNNDTVKMIICTMNVSSITSADFADNYMMDICGCDPKLPLLIQNFLEGR